MNSFDFAILRILTAPANRWPAFDAWVNLLVNWELMKGGMVMAAFWWLWSRPDRGKDSLRPRLLATLAGAALALAAAAMLALVFPYRPRPRFAVGMDPNLSPGWDRWSAFPSDHASLFFALATGLYGIDRKLGYLAFAHAIVVVCLPRLYLGLHYPTDILAGAALGIAGATVALRSARVHKLTVALDRWQARNPALALPGLFLVTYLVATLFTDLRKPASLVVSLLQR